MDGIVSHGNSECTKWQAWRDSPKLPHSSKALVSVPFCFGKILFGWRRIFCVWHWAMKLALPTCPANLFHFTPYLSVDSDGLAHLFWFDLDLFLIYYNATQIACSLSKILVFIAWIKKKNLIYDINIPSRSQLKHNNPKCEFLLCTVFILLDSNTYHRLYRREWTESNRPRDSR